MRKNVRSKKKEVKTWRASAGHGGGKAGARLRGGSLPDSDSGGFWLRFNTANITE